MGRRLLYYMSVSVVQLVAWAGLVRLLSVSGSISVTDWGWAAIAVGALFGLAAVALKQ